MKPHIFILLAFIILSGLIVSPVCASYTPLGDRSWGIFQGIDTWSQSGSNTYSYNAAVDGERISKAEFTVDTGQYVNFTLYYGQNLTVDGSAENALGVDLCWGFIPCPSTITIVTLNGVSESYQYGDINPAFDLVISGYARNNDNNATGLMVYDHGYGTFDNDAAVFFPINNINQNLIYRIDITGSQTFTFTVYHGDVGDVEGFVVNDQSWIDIAYDWMETAAGMAGSLLGFVLMLLGLIKFFFIDNLLLVIALWLGVSMAYSAVSSKNVFVFYKKFFGYQRALFNFMVELWNYLVQIVSSFRGIFRFP